MGKPAQIFWLKARANSREATCGQCSLFGPETKFVGIPADMKQNRSPFDGLQFYGIGRIDGDSRVLTNVAARCRG